MEAPAAARALVFSSARPPLPVMIAPAWPMRLPGGALWPTMSAATGLLNSSSMLGGLLLAAASDFTDEHDGVGVGVIFKHVQHVDEGRSTDRVAADPDARGLDPEPGELSDRLVGERAAA